MPTPFVICPVFDVTVSSRKNIRWTSPERECASCINSISTGKPSTQAAASGRNCCSRQRCVSQEFRGYVFVTPRLFYLSSISCPSQILGFFKANLGQVFDCCLVFHRVFRVCSRTILVSLRLTMLAVNTYGVPGVYKEYRYTSSTRP